MSFFRTEQSFNDRSFFDMRHTIFLLIFGVFLLCSFLFAHVFGHSAQENRARDVSDFLHSAANQCSDTAIATSDQYSDPQSAMRANPLKSLRKTLKAEQQKMLFHNTLILAFLLTLISHFSMFSRWIALSDIPHRTFRFQLILKNALPVRAGPSMS